MSKNVVDMTLRAKIQMEQFSTDVSRIQSILKKLKLPPETRRSFDNLFDETLSDLDKLEKRIAAGFKTKGDVFGFEKASDSLNNSFKKIEDKIFKLYNLNKKDLLKLDPKLSSDIEAIEKKFREISEEFPDNIKNGLKTIGKSVDQLVKDSQKKAGKEIMDKVAAKDYSGALKQAEQKLRQQQLVYDNNIYARKGTVVPQQIDAYKQIVKVLSEAVEYQNLFNNKAELLEFEKSERYAQTLTMVVNNLEQAQNITDQVGKSFKELSLDIGKAGRETVNFNSELDSIKQRVSYFFSLTNSVMLFRRILQDTIQTTKELDAAMTETAVVTDFSVADMWKDLPRYTKIAKELGTTIKGVYETMTLYYQQGLKTEEVVEVGTETLKMARIAGLEYAQATDFMTAALRGFNMEVNELNAQKVNDVYSELAAITAADTQEIATAMTKTASIASSANMEFETTAAFLSQIIETTRESAETAGTAMKTVIARFTELKKDPAEIGEVDGEIVDANKIETALRTINVALRDTSGQFRDLDDVFLDISAKWAGLDTNTQRYIATMAAGSRQQSRFIAMMSDYSRTMELVNAANNSAGASQKQFDKTLESLEAKLNQLKDAWDQFTMGIANNTLIKAGVDALTSFINLLNKITEHLPGPTKGIGNLLLLIAGFKGGEKIFRAFSASILTDFVALAKGTAKAGEKVGDSFFDALKKEFKLKRKLGLTDFFSNELDDSLENIKEKIKNIEEFAEKQGPYKNTFLDYNADYSKLKTSLEDIEFLTNAGIQTDVAASLAKKGLTKEILLEAAAKELGDEATKEELENKAAEIALSKLSYGNSLKNILLKKLESLAYEEGTTQVKKGIIAKTADWILTKMLNKEWLKLFVAIAAVVGVIALVVGSFKLLNHLIETNAEKQERLQKAIEHTSQSMQDSKTAIDDINSSMEELGDLENEFDGLVKGTEAWKEKLAEINNEIIELIKKYPTLIQYVEKGAQGELTINSKGWNEVLEQQQKALSSATLANFTSQAQETQAENKIHLEKLIKDSSFYGLVDSNRIIAAAKEYSKQDKFLTSGQTNDVLKDNYMQKVLNQYAASGDVAIAEFNELISAVKASELQSENYANSVTDSLLQQNDLINDSEYKDGIAKLISSELKIGESGQISSEIEQVLDKKYGNYGKDGQHYNLDKTAIWKDYANLKGKTYQEVKEESKDDDDLYSMALELASQDAAEELSKSAELLVKGLNKIGVTFLKTDKQLSNSFKALFADTLTQQDIDNLKTNQPEFSELPQEIKEYFDNNSLEYQKFINEQIKLAEEQLTSAGEILANLPADELDTSKISAGAMKGLALELQEVFYKSGEEGVKAITESYNAIVGSLDKEQAEKFTSALNGIDWSSVTSINDLKNTLYDIGVYIDDSKLEDLSDDITEFNKATQAVNLDQLISQLELSQSLIEEISDRERNDRSFTKEEKDELIKAGVSEELFVGYGDSWQYVGSSLNDLIVALKENTQAIIGDSTDQLEQKLRLAQASTRIQNEGTYDLANYGVLGVSDKQQLLGNFIKESGLQTIAGYDTKVLGDLTNTNIELDTYQENVLNQILETIANSIGTESNVSAELESYKKQSGIAEYSGKTTAEIVAAATSSDPIESERATNTLLYRAAAYEALGDEIRAYNKAVEVEDKQLANNIKKQIGAKIAIQERAEALDTLDDKVETHLQSLKETNKNTQAYKNILGNLTEDINHAFGTNLASSFFENSPENLSLLESALEGNQEAWDALILKIQEAQVKAIDFEEDYNIVANDISGITNALNNLKFSIEGEADMTKVVESLLAARMTGQQVASFLEKLGYTNIDFKVEGDFDLSSVTSLADLEGKTWSLKATNVNIPAAREYSSFGDYGANSGTKSGDPDDKDSWENSFDRFYNITEDINELLDKRNELEKEYDLLLQNENSTIDDYIKSYAARLGSYKEEIALQEEMLRLRKQDQENILSKYSHLSDYAWMEDGAVYIDYEAIDRVEDQELGEEIEEFVSALEENDEAIQEANDAISENTLAIEDLLDEWRNETADFEQKVFDAIVEQREKEIEKMEEASEALENSNSELVSAIQKEIDERRQQRENKETEENLAEKERRLAYLQQDTSGAYDTEILQLEKDLKQQKEDYTDTLIDQRIADLEQQNDEAAKQREKQIQIAQYQLKNEQDTGVIAQQVSQMLKEATSTAGWNKVWSLLEKSAGFKGLTETNKLVWVEDTRREFQKAMAYLKGSDGIKTDLENISIAVGGYASSVQDNINDVLVQSQSQGSYSGNLGDEGTETVTYGDPVKVDKTAIDYRGNNYYQVGGKWYDANQTNGFDSDKKTTQIAKGANPINNILIKDEVLLSDVGVGFGNTKDAALASIKNNGWNSEKLFGEEFISYNGYYYKYSDVKTRQVTSAKDKNGNVQKGYQAYLPLKSQSYKKYKTGGLADYTGPAWLDGTKSRPELVLNQKDTQNFLQLKDVLGAFMKQNKVINNSTSVGDTVYDISISVEKMTSDYDVEQVATKIKQMISSDAAYRNSTMVQRLR